MSKRECIELNGRICWSQKGKNWLGFRDLHSTHFNYMPLLAKHARSIIAFFIFLFFIFFLETQFVYIRGMRVNEMNGIFFSSKNIIFITLFGSLHFVCFARKPSIKIVFHTFQCLVVLKKYGQKTIFSQRKTFIKIKLIFYKLFSKFFLGKQSLSLTQCMAPINIIFF